MRVTLAASAFVLASLAAFPSAQSTSPRPAAPSSPTSGAPGSTTATPPARSAPADATSAPASIRGRVVSADSGQPLRQVLVRASGQRLESKGAVSDDAGRYEIRGLPPGRYTITAGKGGFVTGRYGQRRPRTQAPPIDLAASEARTGVDFALVRGGVITGTILDEAGDPVSGADIQISRARYVDWERTLIPEGREGLSSGFFTDDLGRFRVFGLAPGEYYLSASSGGIGRGNDDRLGYSPTFYPGTAVGAGARAIVVEAATEVSGIAFALLPARTATISGAVLGPNGAPLPKAFVTLNGTSSGASPVTWAADAKNGAFSFKALPPGDYRLSLSAQVDGVNVNALMRVSVNGVDVTGLVLQPTKGVTARGWFTFDGAAAPPPPFNGIRLSVSSADTSFASSRAVRVSDDGSFELPDVIGHQVRFRASLTEWVLKSVRLGGVEIIDTPIEITGKDIDGLEIVLSPRLTELSGIVVDSRGAPVPEAVVVVFADDRDQWRQGTRQVATARAAADGRFSLRTLPPASYVAVALAALESGEETNPDALEMWRKGAANFTLREGAPHTVRLQVLP